MTEYEQVREKMAFVLSPDYCSAVVDSPDMLDVCEGDCIPCRLKALFSLKHSNRNPMLYVGAEDQSLPRYRRRYNMQPAPLPYVEAQQDMSDYRRIVETG